MSTISRTATMTQPRLPCAIKTEKDFKSSSYDAIVVVITPEFVKSQPEVFTGPLTARIKFDTSAESEVAVLATDLPAGRIISSPTGPLNNDFVDVRSFSDAAKKGIAKAIKIGVTSPLLVLPSHPSFKECDLVTLLGALEGLYVNIQVREETPEKAHNVKTLGVYCDNPERLKQVVTIATALESGRFVTRDIGGADPERMCPPKIEEYIKDLFKDSVIKVEVVSDAGIIEKEYPLFSAVDRAASQIPRHQGRIIHLTYEPAGPVEKTLFLVGKGVTYDTGGCDIKAGGVMAGMSRDKCGAAAAVGFMQVLTLLKPKNIKVVAGLGIVRNSVGPNGYVADEVIVSRSKLRVRVGNTDAEGRMVMGDVLCKARECAESAVNPHIMTFATLTGHAILTVGHGYTIVLDNGPAKKDNQAQQLQAAGDLVGDMIEVSTIRKEDLQFHKVCSSKAGVMVYLETGDNGAGKGMSDDLLQAGNAPSTRTLRGHQGPAAFLVMVSGLDKCGCESKKPIKYTHFDIAASSGDVPEDATGAPVMALAAHFLKEHF